MKLRLFCLFAFLPAFSASAAEPDPISIGNLKEGESVEILYTSQGCFHSMTELFEFKDGVVKFSEIKRKWDAEAKKTIELERKPDGVVKLEKGDAAKLDKLLKFYASDPDGGCTTVDKIEVRLFRNGKAVQEENYTDGSCGSNRLEGVLTLPELLAKRVKEG